MKHRHAFTLVELLVVIGIIAVLIGILLPTLTRARQQAQTLTCAAQLRSVVQLAGMYATENRGSYPWGMSYQRMEPNGAHSPGIPSVTVGSNIFYNRYSWFTLLNEYANKGKYGGLWPCEMQLPSTVANQIPKLSKVFNCPTVQANDNLNPSYTLCSYGAHPVVMPNRSYEINPGVPTEWTGATGSNRDLVGAVGGTTVSISPAKQGQLYPDNAIFWDVQVQVSLPPLIYQPHQLIGGWTYSGIDLGSLAYPQYQNRRYRLQPEAVEDYRRGDMPINFPTTSRERLSAVRYGSEDLYTTTYRKSFTPSVRFRHGKNNQANVAFADGSVRTLIVNMNKVAYLDGNGDEVAQSDFLRRFLKIKKPSNLPSPQVNAD